MAIQTDWEAQLAAVCKTYDVRLSIVEQQLEAMRIRYKYIATNCAIRHLNDTTGKTEQVCSYDSQTYSMGGSK